MPRVGVEFCLRHLEGARDPLEGEHAWYVLMELSSGSEAFPVRDLMESILGEAFEEGLVEDAAFAQNLTQVQDFWHIRHGMSEVQKPEGGSIKHDVSVPVASIPDFLDKAMAAVEDFVPGCRPVPFGHIGDGNIHFNVSQPVGADKEDYLAKWDEMNTIVHGIVGEFGGSISAEHGIGRLKRDLLKDVKQGIELDLMKRIKDAFDPKGLLNRAAFSRALRLLLKADITSARLKAGHRQISTNKKCPVPKAPAFFCCPNLSCQSGFASVACIPNPLQ